MRKVIGDLLAGILLGFLWCIVKGLDAIERYRTRPNAIVPDARDARIAELEEFVRDVRDNYDCDSDAHRYDTRCRSCIAAELLPPK